jgi:hypothetical protein
VNIRVPVDGKAKGRSTTLPGFLQRVSGIFVRRFRPVREKPSLSTPEKDFLTGATEAADRTELFHLGKGYRMPR